MEIDYSAIQPAPAAKPGSWKAPRHVYFGKKDLETGELESEPVYSHQPFPAMLYKEVEGKVVADLVNSQHDLESRKSNGWADSPAAFGHLTAPSHDQIQAAKLKDDAPRRGRPPKVDA